MNETVQYIMTTPLQQGNDPAHLTAVQEYLLPHLPYMEAFWWMVFFCTLLYVFVEYVGRPLWMRVWGR